jgi:hypothetical protein
MQSRNVYLYIASDLQSIDPRNDMRGMPRNARQARGHQYRNADSSIGQVLLVSKILFARAPVRPGRTGTEIHLRVLSNLEKTSVAEIH